MVNRETHGLVVFGQYALVYDNINNSSYIQDTDLRYGKLV